MTNRTCLKACTKETNYSLNDHHHATVPIRKRIFDKMRSQPVNADKEGGAREIDLLKLKVTSLRCEQEPIPTFM